jgi:TatD DNase family protein
VSKSIPQFHTPLIETHCHLDYLEEASLAQLLADCTHQGIERIVTIAVSPDNLSRVRALASQHARVWCTQGIHPHEAERYTPEVERDIVAGFADDKVIAVGEIGLDYYYDHADRQRQREVFVRQLELAVAADLPVVIHSRDADADTRAILAEYAPALRRRGVIHSFTASQELADFSLDVGFYLGFNGIITFKSADNVRAALANTPLERVLLETDAPYLTPVPFRGKTNTPLYLPLVAQHVALVQQRAVEPVLQQCRHNSLELFFLTPDNTLTEHGGCV